MTEDKLVEIIEEIQDKNSSFMGHNEYDLHVRLDIAEYLFNNYNITNKPKKDYYCPDCSKHFNI
jgi:hypothetical protein